MFSILEKCYHYTITKNPHVSGFDQFYDVEETSREMWETNERDAHSFDEYIGKTWVSGEEYEKARESQRYYEIQVYPKNNHSFVDIRCVDLEKGIKAIEGLIQEEFGIL